MIRGKITTSAAFKPQRISTRPEGSSNYAMKPMTIACLSATLALGSTTNAHAEKTLTLRLEADSSRGQVTLVGAEQGNFSARPAIKATQGSNNLHLIGLDKNGKQLFTYSTHDPRILRAESFDPITGKIESVRDVFFKHQQFEVQIPNHPALASLEIGTLSQGKTTLTAANRLGLISIDQVSRLLNKKQAKTLLASSVAGSELLINNGPSEKRLDIVIMGDGYTSAEMAKWRSDAQKVVTGLMADPLFAENSSAFNVRRVDVVSAQSGIDDPPYGIYRNTALNATMACSGIDRLVCADSNLAYNAAAQVTSADGRDVILVVGNTTRYGGGGGYIATMTMHSAATELALHELGHTLFGLADEYDYGSCYGGEPSAPNVTRQTQRAYIKWGAQITGQTPIPTPVNRYTPGTVGLFQGGNYCTTGVYRPTENSKMRNLGYPWDAVNWGVARNIFSRYKDSNTPNPNPNPNPDPDPASTVVNGSLSGNGKFADHPSPYAYLANGGTIKASLKGPSNADFELYLYRWNGSSWQIVAKSESPSSNESINHTANAGYYTIEVYSYRGSGNYTLTYTMPK